MNIEQNLESNTPQILNQQKMQFTEKTGKFDQVYDDDFVALINGLNESIKEYYKVSKNNIQEANSFILFYEKQGIAIQKLTDEIVSTHSYEKISEFFEQIPKINEIMSQLQLNANSNEKNLNLFFEDAKILFKKMRMKRKQKMNELSRNNNENNNVLNDSFANSFNYKKSNCLMKNNLLGNNANSNRRPNQSPFRKILPKNNSNNIITINNIYSQIIKLLTNFSEFNFMLNKVNFEASNRFSNLQNNLKNEIDKLVNLVRNMDKRNSLQNVAPSLNQNQRSRSIPSGLNKELEKLKKMNQINEKKIIDLEINNNNLNLQLIKSQQIIKDKDNLIWNYENNNKGNIINNNNNMMNKNINNIIKQKDMQINNLQQQIYIYQNNENLLNNQINDLNNKFQTKLNQFERFRKSQNSAKTNTNSITSENYEQTIQQLKNEINNYQQLINNYENQIRELSLQNNNNINNMNNNLMNDSNPNFVLQNKIEMLNREMQIKESEYIKEREMLKNRNAINEQKLNQTISNDNKKIEELKLKINQLNKEIINNKRKQNTFEDNNKYAKQIDEMNNNILYLNKIIEQKDELIKQLNDNRNNELSTDVNNNIMINLQLENEQLKNQIQELMNVNNNNLLLNDKINSGNMNMQNNDYISKIKELTSENQKYKESITKTKESITKLESDIKKKNEELEGLKTFIYKLQNDLEKKRDEEEKLDKEKKNVSSLTIKNENETSCNTEPNRRKSISNKDQNKSVGPKDANTNMINNILEQLNDANNKINILQKKNKDLQYQLEEKQVEKDLSGFRTEDVNFSNYEEEFDLKKMVNGARDKNRSEDINIDYPGVQGIKDKYKELLQNMNMLEEQVKILICNISCNNKIKPQITQICQLMRIPAKNIQMIIAGKDKKKALGLII